MGPVVILACVSDGEMVMSGGHSPGDEAHMGSALPAPTCSLQLAGCQVLWALFPRLGPADPGGVCGMCRALTASCYQGLRLVAEGRAGPLGEEPVRCAHGAGPATACPGCDTRMTDSYDLAGNDSLKAKA